MATLATGTAQAASGTTLVTVPADAIGATIQLDVTSAAAAAGDTLNVYIQGTTDSVNYNDFISFTQVLGNGGTKRFTAHWSALATPTTPLALNTDGSQTVSTVTQGPVAKPWRVKWVIAGSTPVFTFTVTASYVRDE